MPLKTIAISPNPATRRGGRLAAARELAAPVVPDDIAPMDVAPEPARRVRAQPAHRYRVGERLRLANGGYVVARTGAWCKVVALLPYEGHGALLYRVRSESEQFERVVAEPDLTRSAP